MLNQKVKNMDLAKLNELVAQKYVKANKHEEADLWIYNYTVATQYEQFWNEITLQCRGLILDGTGNIVARPFSKFFNLGEREDETIPNESFEVFEKMDGSLGVLYWVGDEPRIATKGSFVSEQAIRATEILQQKYASSIGKLAKSNSYIFEIIYPENRIVVDYGEQEELVLLGITETESGKELPLVDIGFPIVKKYNGIQDIGKLKDLEEKNREGFVIRFQNGLRLKVKFDEYQRIHRIVTQISSYDIWEWLRDGRQLQELLEDVPDEFYDWVRKIERDLKNDFSNIEIQTKKALETILQKHETEQKVAEAILAETYPKVLFAMKNGKNHEPIIWKRIKPKYEKPFSNSDEMEM